LACDMMKTGSQMIDAVPGLSAHAADAGWR
jgi:hypothetical protein